MKKVKVLLKVLTMAMVLAGLTLSPVFAEDAAADKAADQTADAVKATETTEAKEAKEIDVVKADSGYKLSVPGYVDTKEVEVDGAKVSVIVVKAPEKNADGTYTLFDIKTTVKDAVKVKSTPTAKEKDLISAFEGDVKDGSVAYAVKFAKELKDIEKEQVIKCDFSVLDKNGKELFAGKDVNLTFAVELEKTEATVEEVPNQVVDVPAVVTAKPTASKVSINGKEVAFEAYNINGNNFFKLRDIAMSVNGTEKQFEVAFDAAKNAINLTATTAYTAVGGELEVAANPVEKQGNLTKSAIYMGDAELQLTAYNIGGNNYFKLRDVGQAFNFGVSFDAAKNMIVIDTTQAYVAE